MSIAFVLGNGRSRLAVNPLELKSYGPVYACNAIYKQFTPDVLVSTDRPIATSIMESGYSLSNRFHTRHLLEGYGALPLHKPYRGFSSGPNAVGLACVDGYARIFMLGFDLGTTDGQFNNVFAGEQFYKKPTDPPTFSGNWIKQIKQICSDFPTREFVRVEGPETAQITALKEVKNLKFMPMSEFVDRLNNKKGLL